MKPHAPRDPAWDAARRAWNLAVDQSPALVALPACVADVQAVVNHAREPDCGSRCKAPDTTPRRSATSSKPCS